MHIMNDESINSNTYNRVNTGNSDHGVDSNSDLWQFPYKKKLIQSELPQFTLYSLLTLILLIRSELFHM